MRPVSGKKMCKALEANGWTLDRIKGSHHVYTRTGDAAIVVPVHGNQDLATGTQRTINRDAGLTDGDLA